MAAVPEWVTPGSGQVIEQLERTIACVESSGRMAEYLAPHLWVLGDGVAPVTGRPDQPVTAEVAEVEWWSAWAAVNPTSMHLAPLAEVSQEVGVVYRRPQEVGIAVAHATWAVLSWLLGVQDPQGPNGLAPWLFDGPIPSAEQLLWQTPQAQGGARYPAQQWAALRQRVRCDAVRYRRIATRLRHIEQARS
jgi:hypothetical protein